MSSAPLLLEREFIVGPVRVTVWNGGTFLHGGQVLEPRRIAIDRLRDLGGTSRQDTLTPPDIPMAILALKKAHDYLDLAERHPQAPGTGQVHKIKTPERIP